MSDFVAQNLAQNVLRIIAQAVARTRMEQDAAAGFPIVSSRYLPPLAMDHHTARVVLDDLNTVGLEVVVRAKS